MFISPSKTEMPEGEPTQNNMIENVLTGPKGYWGARARSAGLPPTSKNLTRRRSKRPRKREHVYMRPVPESNRAIRFRNPGGIFNAVEQGLMKRELRPANNYTERYNGKTMKEIREMPRPERKNLESKMSHNTYVKYASNSLRISVNGFPVKFIVAMPWPHFRNFVNTLERSEQERILKFMEIIYFRIRQEKAKKVFGGLTLEEIGRKSEDDFEKFQESLSEKNASDLVSELYGDFKGRTLTDIVHSLEYGRPGSTLEERDHAFMEFIRSFPPKEKHEIILLVNLYIMYPPMRGKDLPGYSDGKWDANF